MALTDESAPESTTTEPEPTRLLSWWICVAIGIASALVGLLPWLVTGMRLPLQNLWAADTAPESMPIVLLPFSQYSVTLLFGLIVVGSAVGGVTARATRQRQSRRGALWISLGLVLMQAIAVVQTAIPVINGMQRRSDASLYIAVVLGVIVLSILIGVGVFALISWAPRAGATIGISVAAIAAGIWWGQLLHPLFDPANGSGMWLLGAVRWIPAIIVGVGLAWGGLNTVGRIVAAVVSLVILWLVPAAVTAIDNAAGSRVLARVPQQMIDYAINVFFTALSIPELVIPPLVVAVVIAVGGAILGTALRRRSAAAAVAPSS